MGSFLYPLIRYLGLVAYLTSCLGVNLLHSVWKFTAEPKDEDALPALTNLTSTPGEWISASYSGEGMVHAWLCAKALAYMVLDAEEDGGLKEWFPEVMRVTEERWKKANVDDLLEELGGDS